MDIILLILGILLCLVAGLITVNRSIRKVDKSAVSDSPPIEHNKKEYLATKNEQKLYFALRKSLNKNYQIHCQTSLIAIVDPVEFKDKKRAWSKRMDFVITDTATKIIAVIELDDASHNSPKRIARDNYVNSALKPHHPLIRIKTTSFYRPEEVAEALENYAGIANIFKLSEVDDNKNRSQIVSHEAVSAI